MQSDDIRISVNRRIVEQSTGEYIEIFPGIIIAMTFQSPEEKAKLFRKALLDYSIEKLDRTKENKVIVEDMEFIMSRLNKQFRCEDEQEAFYKNYAYCLLDAYAELIGTPLMWQDVRIDETGEFPRVVDGVFQTPPSVSYETATLWLFEKFEQQLKKVESPKTKKKGGRFRWR